MKNSICVVMKFVSVVQEEASVPSLLSKGSAISKEKRKLELMQSKSVSRIQTSEVPSLSYNCLYNKEPVFCR